MIISSASDYFLCVDNTVLCMLHVMCSSFLQCVTELQTECSTLPPGVVGLSRCASGQLCVRESVSE